MKPLHPKTQKILDISKRKTLTGKPKDSVEVYSLKNKYDKNTSASSYYLPKN